MNQQNKITMLPNEINMNKIKTSEMKSLGNGAKIMYLNYGEQPNTGPLIIQTPVMALLWDSSYFADNGDGNGKVSCKLNFKGYDSDTNINDFKEKMEEFDNHLINLAVTNSKKWFSGKTLSKDTIEQLYTPMVKYSINTETGEVNTQFAPSFSFKITQKNGKYNCKFFNEKRELINVNNSDDDTYVDINKILKRGTTISSLLVCNGLWFAGGKFGCTWKAEQIKGQMVTKANLDTYAFREDDVEEEEFIEDSDNDE